MNCPCTGAYLPRLIPAVLAGFAAIFGTDYVIHHILLMDIYVETSDLWRPQEDMATNFPIMLGYQFLFTFLLSLIFVKGYKGKGLPEGIRFGLYLGLLVGLLSAAAWIWMPIPIELAGGWFAAGLAQCLVLGIIFSLIYKDPNKGACKTTGEDKKEGGCN